MAAAGGCSGQADPRDVKIRDLEAELTRERKGAVDIRSQLEYQEAETARERDFARRRADVAEKHARELEWACAAKDAVLRKLEWESKESFVRCPRCCAAVAIGSTRAHIPGCDLEKALSSVAEKG